MPMEASSEEEEAKRELSENSLSFYWPPNYPVDSIRTIHTIHRYPNRQGCIILTHC